MIPTGPGVAGCEDGWRVGTWRGGTGPPKDPALASAPRPVWTTSDRQMNLCCSSRGLCSSSSQPRGDSYFKVRVQKSYQSAHAASGKQQNETF